MRHSSRLRTAAVATSVATGLALSGCTVEAPGTSTSMPGEVNQLAVHDQLRQAANYAASLIGCMVQDEKAYTYTSEWGNLTNADPSGNLINDDIPQEVAFSVDINESLRSPEPGDETASYYAFNKNAGSRDDHYSITISGPTGAGPAWREAGKRVGPSLINHMTRTFEPTGAIIETPRYPNDVYITFPEGYAATANLSKQPDKLVTMETATQLSDAITDVAQQLLTRSGITSCELG